MKAARRGLAKIPGLHAKGQPECKAGPDAGGFFEEPFAGRIKKDHSQSKNFTERDAGKKAGRTHGLENAKNGRRSINQNESRIGQRANRSV